MAKAAAASKTESKTRRVSRSTKLERKLNGTSARTSFTVKDAQVTVTGYSNVPVEIPGDQVEHPDQCVSSRHKLTSASKRMVVSCFAKSEVLELFGKEKEVGAITVMKRKAFTEATGTVKVTQDSIRVTNADGEVTTFFKTAGAEYEIKAADEAGSQPSNRGRKAAAPVETVKKSSKVVEIDRGRKAKAKKK